MKKILILIVVLAILGGGAYYYYRVYMDDGDVQIFAPELKTLAEGPVIDPVPSKGNDAVWYGLATGRLMRLDLRAGSATEHPLPPITGNFFKSILWPETGSDFIALGLSDNLDTFSYFDYDENKYYTLPKNVQDLDWLNDSIRVAMVWKGGDGKVSLVVSNADGSGYRIVTSLPWDDLAIKASPATNTALLYRQPAQGEISKIYTFDLQTGSYEDTIATGRNTGAVWSPTGNQFAFTRLSAAGSELFIYDLLTRKEMSTGLVTGINRVAFSPDGAKLYVAQVTDSGVDEVYLVDAATAEKSLLYPTQFGIKARSLFLVGQKVYFVSSPDNKIQTVE